MLQPDGHMPSDKAAGDDSFATFFSEVGGAIVKSSTHNTLIITQTGNYNPHIILEIIT